MLHTKFKETEPRGSKVETFLNICLFFSLELHWNKFDKEQLDNATYQILSL